MAFLQQTARLFSRASAPRSLVLGQRRCFSAAIEELDLVIIGGGPGGYVAAIKAGQLGMKVACVEKRGSLGGTCLNVGCIPSKALLHSSHLYAEAKSGFGPHGIKIDTNSVEIDLPELMKHKDKVVKGLTGGIEGLFKKNKVQYVKGLGEIKRVGEVMVHGIDGTETTLKCKNILIATGSEVANLNGVPIDEKRIVSSTGALSLPEVPKNMIVIGAGVIGLEMGSVWNRLGSKVTAVEFLDRITPGIDSECTKTFQNVLKKQGMKFKLSTKVMGAEVTDSGVVLTTEPVAGGPQEKMEADYVLVATGRVPNTEGLGLENVGVKMGPRGMVDVDDHFSTNIKGIYAIGDVIKGPMLAHKAEEEGIAAVEMLAGKAGHVNYDCIPGVIYTHPEVATVGKSEDDCKAEGIPYVIGKFPFMANSRARANADADGLVKFVSCKETDRILGIHIVGAGAGEMIAEGVLAMEYGASSEDVARTCHAHPTMSEAFKEAAMAAYDKPIHF